MPDHRPFLESLSRFAQSLVAPRDVEVVLGELTEHVTAVLGLAGSGVSLVRGGPLHVGDPADHAVVDLEQAQHDHARGPGLDAIRTGEVVAITDIGHHEERWWPEYVAAARRHSVSSVAAIPLAQGGETVGSLNLYSRELRAWSDDDLVTARVFADMATAYLVHASELDQQRQLNGQLQRALDQRVVIEQAKGITAHAHSTSIDEAFALIRRHARDHNASIQVVAEAIVNAGLRV
ncbi:ANTAR domain-containing response regulator [Nocardioides sp. LS1]|uniref:ANTAR domain-containing response regulator n=1 Tax=Nocardioides sp. LS1 TaxID=1027620 RepID=UPI000F62534B|nr:GAF and ANTAR domain-containing protein [Nocardioides sp. LS1]GCD88564.1 transcriptional regulator [Nocardioides sp. LS1]